MKPITFLAVVTVLSVGVAQAADVFMPGFLKHEFFKDQTRATVEAGTAGAPTRTEFLTSFETAINFDDNYANRISGFFIPDVTGDYVIFICSDDDQDFFISTNDQPATKRLVAQEAGWSNSRMWNTVGGGGSTASQKRSDQW